MTSIQDPQAIIALVGIFVTLPPTMYITWKVYVRRKHQRSRLQVESPPDAASDGVALLPQTCHSSQYNLIKRDELIPKLTSYRMKGSQTQSTTTAVQQQ
ncbi:hypothetical protein QBC44DRAFT_369006 [Cladorrhinum sp. PSN332]|nr:hypothetical protein QBC44DRAFT_369006 [Cladorrhinum sp. PSN332]